MKKFLFMCLMAAGVTFSSCGGGKAAEESGKDTGDAVKADSKVLVAYFSATGTTAKAAKEVAEATGGILYQIEPEKAYTDEDLDYENDNSRSSMENKNPEMRPAIKKGVGTGPYDTIYLGFPVWWDKAPLVVYTYLDSHDFTDKKIVVFGTAHSSGLTPSFEALKAAYPNYHFTEGAILNVTSKKTFNEWVESLKK